MLKLDTKAQEPTWQQICEVDTRLTYEALRLQAVVNMQANLSAALEPIAHHKRADMHIVHFLREACPEYHTSFCERFTSRSFFASDDRDRHMPKPPVTHYSDSVVTRAELEIALPQVLSVQELIRSLDTNAYYRELLVATRQQLGALELMAESECRLREHLQAFEAYRAAAYANITGEHTRPYFHRSVERLFPCSVRKKTVPDLDHFHNPSHLFDTDAPGIRRHTMTYIHTVQDLKAVILEKAAEAESNVVLLPPGKHKAHEVEKLLCIGHGLRIAALWCQVHIDTVQTRQDMEDAKAIAAQFQPQFTFLAPTQEQVQE